MWFFLALLAVPLIEIGLFIEVGGLIGVWPTLGLVLLAAVAGSAVLRRQGARSNLKMREAMAGIDDPAAPLAHGAMIVLAGVLLMIPGFFSDAVALALLIPQVRSLILRRIAARIQMRGVVMTAQHRHEPHRPDVIDAEFQEIDGDSPPPRGPSGWTRP